MATNYFPGIGKKTHGRDFNYFRKIDIIASDFGSESVSGEQPDAFITFPTTTVMLLNESATGIVEYSFNGTIVHGELDPLLPTRGMTFDNRTISLIWFRIKPGSSGPVTVRIDAW